MSMPTYDVDEGLWELYITDCRMAKATPSIKDFLVWCEEKDYDLPEVWDGEMEANDAY